MDIMLIILFASSSQNRQVPLLNTANIPKSPTNRFFNTHNTNNNEYINMTDKQETSRDFDITHIFRKLKSKITGKPANLGLNDRQQSHQQQPREINIMNHSANAGFGYYGNHISTTKYNIATFYQNFFSNNLVNMPIYFSLLHRLFNKYLMFPHK